MPSPDILITRDPDTRTKLHALFQVIAFNKGSSIQVLTFLDHSASINSNDHVGVITMLVSLSTPIPSKTHHSCNTFFSRSRHHRRCLYGLLSDSLACGAFQFLTRCFMFRSDCRQGGHVFVLHIRIGCSRRGHA
ncbi:hypothetical protein C8J56DRAFT_1051910 [Mycena floridula]|nr:hypothetical protein C8J56DRAFT_1051910 [Mycena floridula]